MQTDIMSNVEIEVTKLCDDYKATPTSPLHNIVQSFINNARGHLDGEEDFDRFISETKPFHSAPCANQSKGVATRLKYSECSSVFGPPEYREQHQITFSGTKAEVYCTLTIDTNTGSTYCTVSFAEDLSIHVQSRIASELFTPMSSRQWSQLLYGPYQQSKTSQELSLQWAVDIEPDYNFE